MTHKVHPKLFRLREIADWDSRWLNKKKFSAFLEEDFRIREFLEKKLKNCSVQNVEIERSSSKVNIIINTARPGFIIGRGGKGAEDLKKEIDNLLKKERPSSAKASEDRELKIEIREIKNPWLSASLAGKWISEQLERRIYHRRVIKQALEKIMANKEIKGARIEISGRLGGSEIARREWLKKGRMPRQTLRAVIDYAQVEALCAYGVVGVKVWIYKGDKFE